MMICSRDLAHIRVVFSTLQDVLCCYQTVETEDGGGEDSSSWLSGLLCSELISGSGSSSPEGCPISCFGLSRLLSLAGSSDP